MICFIYLHCQVEEPTALSEYPSNLISNQDRYPGETELHGSLSAANADGYAKIRPISSHNLMITNYASYRGLLLLSGVDPKAASANKHVVVSDDKKLAVWAGVIGQVVTSSRNPSLKIGLLGKLNLHLLN